MAVLLVDDVIPFELAAPQEVFTVASRLVGGAYAVTTVGPGPVDTPIGRLAPTHDLAALRHADVVVVPGREDPDAPVDERVLEALRSAAASGARIVGLCTGSFVLARAGLLDGRRATTHWRFARLLARRYSTVSVEPDRLFVVDGDVVTSAGVAAALDLCLDLVRRDLGADVANAVARHLVTPAYRSGGQRQYVERPVPAAGDGDALQEILRAVTARLDEPLTLADIAGAVGWSERTLLRRFREGVGTSPLRWLTERRIEEAQRLLETTQLPVERIAGAVGFGSAATLRSHFSAVVGVSPQQYRRTFHAPVSTT